MAGSEEREEESETVYAERSTMLTLPTVQV